jgi:hypothetical protein
VPLNAQLEEVAKHCHKSWHPEQVIAATNDFIKSRETTIKLAAPLHFEEIDKKTIGELIKLFDGVESPLNCQIRQEVIHWLKTTSAFNDKCLSGI